MDTSDSQEASTDNTSECLLETLQYEGSGCTGEKEEVVEGLMDNGQVQTDGGNDMPIIISSASSPQSSDTEEPSLLGNESTQTKLEVSQEFAWRAHCVQQDDDIHHFNWLGSPVYRYNWTPAVVSLLYILSDPKVPQPGDEWRMQSILHRAAAFVDPVVVYLENGLSDLQTKGHQLIRFATERVFKFYSPHGQWANDSLEKDDQTTIDDGDFYTYISPNLASSNGFVEICPIRSRYKWAEARNELFASARAFNGNLYRAKARKRVYTPSPLRHLVVYGDQVLDTAADKAEDVREPECGNSEEALDRVCDLPALATSRKRSLQVSSCSPSQEPLKRRHSSFDLKSEFDDDIHELLVSDDPKATTNGVAKADVDSSMTSRCTDSSGEDQASSGRSSSLQADQETIRERSSTPPTDRTSLTENTLLSPQLELHPTTEFISSRVCDVQFISIGSRGRGSRATLHDWKTKFKKGLHVKNWQEVSIKTRSVLRLGADHRSSSPSHSSSSTSTSPSTTPEQVPIVESKFAEEYFSFPTPTFSSSGSEFDLKDAQNGHGHSTKSSFGSKLSSKARLLCKKAKDSSLRISSGEDSSKGKRRLVSKVARHCVVQCSSMAPYPYYAA